MSDVQGSGTAGMTAAADSSWWQRRRDESRTTIATGPSVPAWLLRLLLAVTVGAGVTVATSDTQRLIAVLLGLVLAVRPHPSLVAVSVAVIAAILVINPPVPWQLAVVLLLTHLMLRLGAVAEAVAIRGRVELAVLRASWRPFLTVQLLAQMLGALGAVLAGAPAVPWLAVVAVVGLAGLVGWLLTQLRTAAGRWLPPR